MPDTVLILGAAGRLGQCLVQAFSRGEWRVLAQARKPLSAELLGLPGVQPLHFDALDVAGLRRAASIAAGDPGVQVLINALNPIYTQWDTLALPLADAAQDLALALGALLMLPGNVYNFGNALPSVLRPDTPEVGNTPKARTRIEIESRMAAAQSQGLKSVVIRAGDFFGGSGRGSWFDLALASRVHKGRFIYPGPLLPIHAWAYLPDLAESFVRVAAQRSRWTGHLRLHFEGHCVSGQQLCEALSAAAGRPLRPGDLPWPLIRLVAPLVPMWRDMLQMRYLWQRPHRLDGQALGALIGPEPHTDLVSALQTSLQTLALATPAAQAKAMPQH